MKSLPMSDWVKSQAVLFTRPAVFILIGDLAAGKTTFVSEVVKHLKSEEKVSSPTFALHHQYLTPSLTVDHMDLYRLKSDEDLSSSGFFEILEETSNLFFVEWGDRLPIEVYKKSRPVYEIHFKVIGEKREFTLTQRF